MRYLPKTDALIFILKYRENGEQRELIIWDEDELLDMLFYPWGVDERYIKEGIETMTYREYKLNRVIKLN